MVYYKKYVLRNQAILNSIKKLNSDPYRSLSPDEKKQELFSSQKKLLDTFLSTGAITQAQHDKSLNCLIEKMEIGKPQENIRG